MKKSLVLLLILGLVAGALSVPATAAKKKKKPVATTLYLHGNTPIGEVDSVEGLNAGTYMGMDATEPSNPEPSSIGLVGPIAGQAGPNTDCAGNQLFPIWTGSLAGKVKGDLKVTFDVVASGGTVDLRIWPDVSSLMCDGGLDGSANSYVPPAAQQEVTLPNGPGTVEATFEDVKFKAVGSLMFQITVLETPPYGRVLYNSADFPARLEFTCIPASGKSCTP